MAWWRTLGVRSRRIGGDLESGDSIIADTFLLLMAFRGEQDVDGTGSERGGVKDVIPRVGEGDV